ncbi:probable phytanoyl-CoA dioxygenase [Diaphorina citri]|uniref:Probable phytanoyl-CoA dioxygenase n=1 Tax=Diaphorina citri TaxID=121845 RepID=A0A1S3DN11_DIACI|nr:probable phytanoyl-CoA dioxygenase [Diaphorina citri]
MASTVQSAEPMSCPVRRFSTKLAYQYSINANNLLTREQQEFYEVEGYLVIPKLIEDEVLDECRDRFVALCEGRVDKGPMTMMKDISLAKTGAKGEYLYNKVQELVYDEVFEKYTMHKKLLDYVESFIGPASTVNAFYSPVENSIAFPAGVLQAEKSQFEAVLNHWKPIMAHFQPFVGA